MVLDQVGRSLGVGGGARATAVDAIMDLSQLIRDTIGHICPEGTQVGGKRTTQVNWKITSYWFQVHAHIMIWYTVFPRSDTAATNCN